MAGGMTLRLAPLRPAWQALTLLAALAAPADGLEARGTASEYISTVCTDYGTAYGPLVESCLSQYQAGFSTADILQLPAMYNGSRSDTLIRLCHAKHAALLPQDCALLPFTAGLAASQQTSAATCHALQHRVYTRLLWMVWQQAWFTCLHRTNPQEIPLNKTGSIHSNGRIDKCLPL